MTTEIIQNTRFDEHFYHQQLRNLAPFFVAAKRNGITTQNCSTSRNELKPSFATPTPQAPKQKPRVSNAPKHTLKLDISGKRYPQAFKKTLRVQVGRDVVRKIYLEQALQEEKSCVKMLGVALFYKTLLKELTGHCCPVCQRHCDDMIKLEEKIQHDVDYFIDYIPKSKARKDRDEFLVKVIMQRCHIPGYLSSSEKISQIFHSPEMNKLQLKELQQGARDALRLLKATLLKDNKCGVCESTFASQGQTTVASVLSTIDKRLSKLN